MKPIIKRARTIAAMLVIASMASGIVAFACAMVGK
jgi:hypothetical protein